MHTIETMPLFTGRWRIGQIRHVILHVAELKAGLVANLSTCVLQELAEVWFVPKVGKAFTQHELDSAKITVDELFAYCSTGEVKERVLRKLFTNLPSSDAVWHFEMKRVGSGLVVRAIVAHRTAMKAVLSEGLISPRNEGEERNQHNLRGFAFGDIPRGH